jgi:hypothetical protein
MNKTELLKKLKEVAESLEHDDVRESDLGELIPSDVREDSLSYTRLAIEVLS